MELRGVDVAVLRSLERSVPVLLVLEGLSPADTEGVQALRALLREEVPLLALVTAPLDDPDHPHPLLADQRCRPMPLPAPNRAWSSGSQPNSCIIGAMKIDGSATLPVTTICAPCRRASAICSAPR